ncbi:MAG: cell division protein ZapA [Candidatus Cloacimonetes bacterium]|nr:cell division protein ZapA [Candidatus Cloacimonadota bacterium]
MQTVEVVILGKKYRLRSDDPDKLHEYAEYLNNTLDEIIAKYGLVDAKDTLTLAGMILTEQLFHLTEDSDHLKKEIDKLHSKISSFIKDIAKK